MRTPVPPVSDKKAVERDLATEFSSQPATSSPDKIVPASFPGKEVALIDPLAVCAQLDAFLSQTDAPAEGSSIGQPEPSSVDKEKFHRAKARLTEIFAMTFPAFVYSTVPQELPALLADLEGCSDLTPDQMACLNDLDSLEKHGNDRRSSGCS